MGNFAQLVCDTTFKNEKKIKKVSEPLAQGFGLDTFWYYSLTKEGELCYLSNNAVIADYFYSNELYKGHPYFKTPDLIKPGFFFAEKTTAADYTQTQGRLRDVVTMDQIFAVMNVEGGRVEGYGFATTKNLPDLTNSIINNLYLFKKFIHYFHEEAGDVLKQMRKNSVDIAAECQKSFYEPTSYFDALASNSNPLSFSDQIDPKRFEMLNSLSVREKECLKWFLKGLSAPQIGKKIHLSSRTVEFYMNNIKNKLCCNTKQELFEVLLNSRDFLMLTFF